jgi:hypothetical protein
LDRKGIKSKNSKITQCGSLDNEEQILDFKAQVKIKREEIEKAYVSRYDEVGKEIIVEFLI